MAQGNPRYYQPSITRLPSLLALLALTLALIALVELAVRHFPALATAGIVKTIHANKQRDLWHHQYRARDAQLDAQFASNTVASVLSTTPIPAPSNPSAPDAPFSTAAPSAYLPVDQNNQAPTSPDIPVIPVGPGGGGTPDAPTATAAPSAYLPIDQSNQAPTSPDIPVIPVGPGDGGTPDAPTAPAAPSAYLPIDQNNQTPTSPDVPVGPGGGGTPAATPGATAYIPVEPAAAGPGATDPIPVGPVATGIGSTDDRGTRGAEGAIAGSHSGLPSVTAILDDGAYGTPAVEIRPATAVSPALATSTYQTSPGGRSRSSVQPSGSSETSHPRTGDINGVTYSVGPSGAVVDGKTYGYATPTTAVIPSGKVVVVSPSGAVSVQESPELEQSSRPRKGVTWREYVIGAFLPTALAVIFSIPWPILFAAIQEMEPFYQLNDPDGALARDSLCLDYGASVNVATIVKAGLRGHFVVFWTGICSVAVLALAPLASETVFIGFVGEGRCTATSSRDACQPQLSVYPVAARVLQGILGLVAVLTICIAVTIVRRSSGVHADPRSIAGTASLFQNSRLVEEFRQLDLHVLDDTRLLEIHLEDNRYRLGYFQPQDGSTEYGIHRHVEPNFYSDHHIAPNPLYNTAILSNKNKRYAAVSVSPVTAEPQQCRRPKLDYLVHHFTVAAFALCVAGLLILVVYYNRTGGDTGFERFMDSQAFGVTFLFTALGVLIKMYWTVLDANLRSMHPYRLLALSSSLAPRAQESILEAPSSNPFSGLINSTRSKAWLQAWLSLVAILTEPLIIALANIPFKPGTAFVAYQASTYVTIGVLSLMLLGCMGVLNVKRGAHTEGMRMASDVARDRAMGRTMGLICASSMLRDFRGLAEMGTHQRDQMVKEWGKSYRMGNVVGVDRVERYGIDEERFVEPTDP